MANIPFISSEPAESFGASLAAPFSSSQEASPFDSYLKEAGSAIEETVSEPDAPKATPAAEKKADGPETAEASASDEGDEEVEAASGDRSSEEAEDSGAEADEAAPETAQSGEEPENSQGGAAEDEAKNTGLIPVGLVEALIATRPAARAVAGAGTEGEAAEVAPVAVSPGASGSQNENLPQRTIIAAGEIVSAPAASGESAPQSGGSGRSGENPAPAQGNGITRAASPAGIAAAEFSVSDSPLVDEHLPKIQIEVRQSAPAATPEAAKIGAPAPIDIEGQINAAALKVAEAAGKPVEEASGQPKQAAAPAAPAAPVAAPKAQAATGDEGAEQSVLAPATDGEGAVVPQADADKAIITRAAGQAAKEAAPEELVAPRNNVQPETQQAVAVKVDTLASEIEGRLEAQAASRPAGARMEAALKMSLQEQVLETAVSRLNLAVRDKVASARIRLDPPSLGRMDMKIHIEAGMLSAKVTVESVWVKDAITSNLKDLRDALQEHGFEVEEFSVDVDAGMDAWNSDRGQESESFEDSLLFGSGAQEEELEAELTAADGGSVLGALGGDTNTVDLFA